ncbi:MAG: hypothetical protein DRP35_02515 [Candidatus Zixiibacteriota bacterium]|nr:MAG: hypothetical protein DRP35_02515 [candidate division Zixibacteria bacterium]
MVKNSLTNLILRGISLVSKFFLMFVMARLLSPEELGIWGLMNLSISISIILVGLDFYHFNAREILAVESSQYVYYIKDQFVLHLSSYLFFLPLLSILFIVEILPWKYMLWFYLIFVFEHFSEELNRILVVLSKSAVANLSLFFRTGFWVYIIIYFLIEEPDLRELPTIWFGWVIGIILSIILACYALRKLPWNIIFEKSVDWGRIKKGISISLPLLVATLAFVTMQHLDRIFLKIYYSEAEVGVFTFFFNIANVAQVAIFTGVIMIIYPKLIESFQKKDFDQYKLSMRKMMKGIVLGLVILIIGELISIKPVLKLVNKEIFNDNLNIFYLMLVNTSLLAISYIPHYSLFVRKMDFSIIFSTLVALVVAVIANFILVPAYGMVGAAFSTMTGFAVILILKSINAFRHRRI